ncbi:MAG: Asp-tRNA(Asn)/Glu-tRNA(Gln) amidotransferase subunit GatC, partial [Clostridiales bacterium]|nr:Asp-tRNA(Asn)/Glu-tRNA(Gln) amidotransferase subunit GatC [Clostridiales bacterium]
DKKESEIEIEIKLDINELEELSELLLDKKEKEEIEKEIRELIKFAAILRDIDTDGVAPTINIHPIPNATRKDIVEKEFTREELLANAPTVVEGYILVPRVIE